MPPREATGSFPDQFIVFDYELPVPATALPNVLVVQPPLPQPPPEPVPSNPLNAAVDPLSIDSSRRLPSVLDVEDDDDDDDEQDHETPLSLGSHPTLVSPTPAVSSSLPPQQQQQQQQHDSLPNLEITQDEDDDDDDQTMTSSQSDFHILSQSSQDSIHSSESLRMIYRNTAFDGDDTVRSQQTIHLEFHESTTVADLKYFAERGCIVQLLQALVTPRLVTLGARMLADYAKLAHRRKAVASNRKILDFCQLTMLSDAQSTLGREYAVETIRSLTATEESDHYLLSCPGLLTALALVARGGPIVQPPPQQQQQQQQPHGIAVALASDKARLHACIAIMNLSCGKANKLEIAKFPEVLESMRDVMMRDHDEARLKATTCIKNLSNADANDYALLHTPGLLPALAHVARITCIPEATPGTTNACLAIMNLSIAKNNKHRVFRTPGVMEALLTVLARTQPGSEARIKACSALSNLAIGYDNKIPMFEYPHFCEAILSVIREDQGEARTKACSILWSFAAEMKNQVPVVRRGDIVPVLVQVASDDASEARFKCVAALTLLAESWENAVPLLMAGALQPLMEILHDAGPDPTQWKGQTASWCVGFLMNMAQNNEAAPALREAGVVELLAPLLVLDHYQSLKAAMAVTFCCRLEGDECYDLLRKTETVIPKIISLLHNTLSGRGGNGYKYGVFTLRSSVGCIDALASGPDYLQERVATAPVLESLLRVIADFCVDGGTPGAIVGGGRDDILSATLAVRAMQALIAHLIPIVGSSALPYPNLEDRLLQALECFEMGNHEAPDEYRRLAADAKERIRGGRRAVRSPCNLVHDDSDMASLASNCCGFHSLPGLGDDFLNALSIPTLQREGLAPRIVSTPSIIEKDDEDEQELPVRTFLLADARTGRRFVVPTDPSGGRTFNDARVWCYRRGRFCRAGEAADPNYVWNAELQEAYEVALARERERSEGNYA